MGETDSGADVSNRDEVFASFVRRRSTLNESLDVSRKAIDVWLERQPMPPPLNALANLEVLLKGRRDLLAELVKLDDDFMLHLIQMRRSGSSES